MLLDLSPDQALFRETTARLLDELVPVAELRRLRDSADGFDPELLASRGGTGLVLASGQRDAWRGIHKRARLGRLVAGGP